MNTQKINVAKIKKFGHNFEISINPDAALKYKKGEITDLNEVLLAEEIFTEAKKGLVAADNKLMEAFKTTDITKIADIILKSGEIQATAEHRSEEREQQKRKLINLIHRNAVDPKTGFPYPPNRIETALEEGKIHLDYNRSVEEQFDDIITKLRPIIPIKIEQKKMKVIIPAHFAGKLYSFVKGNSTILGEEWMNNGNWKVKIELPAGLQQEFIDKLNSLTHGEVMVEIE
ncbi:MAG: ribosome assembly factor SBDS [Nanoarchaeota archaeon]